MSISDCKNPIFFINGEELAHFSQDSSHDCIEGTAYEWEGESVYHLHFSPLLHSFGRKHSVLYTKKSPFEESDEIMLALGEDGESIYAINKQKRLFYDFVVTVGQDGSARVWIKDCETPIIPNIIPSKADLYSRNKGLIELDILEKKRVMIVGLGSFGSQIAIELAKAGVGQFALMDFDRVELHNLARHTSTTNDLGRLKTDVISDAIVGKNPYAIVEKYPIDINDHPDLLVEQSKKANLVICATDNNRSRFNLSDALVKTSTIGIFGRAITRAEGGDVFIYRPGGPCYCCLLGNSWYDSTMEEITNADSARREGRIAAYVSPEDADAMVQVGLSADIEPMCNMMVKLALVELSRGANSGISSLEDEFVDPYYIWVNRRERKYSNWASFANPGQMPTIMRWYAVELGRNEQCAICGNATGLDVGEDFVKEFGSDASRININASIDLDKLKDEANKEHDNSIFLARIESERNVLSYYLPSNSFQFKKDENDTMHLESVVKTNDGSDFILYIDLKDFPKSMPCVYVEQILYDHTGEAMDKASIDNYTGEAKDDKWTQLIIFDEDNWHNDTTLWKIYILSRIWLEAYKNHLKTGKLIREYLNEKTVDERFKEGINEFK